MWAYYSVHTTEIRQVVPRLRGRFGLKQTWSYSNVGRVGLSFDAVPLPETTQTRVRGWRGWRLWTSSELAGAALSSDVTSRHYWNRNRVSVQCRCMELAAGRPPKERRTTYVRVEHEIAQAELKVPNTNRTFVLLRLPSSHSRAPWHFCYTDAYLLGPCELSSQEA